MFKIILTAVSLVLTILVILYAPGDNTKHMGEVVELAIILLVSVFSFWIGGQKKKKASVAKDYTWKKYGITLRAPGGWSLYPFNERKERHPKFGVYNKTGGIIVFEPFMYSDLEEGKMLQGIFDAFVSGYGQKVDSWSMVYETFAEKLDDRTLLSTRYTGMDKKKMCYDIYAMDFGQEKGFAIIIATCEEKDYPDNRKDFGEIVRSVRM